MNRKKIIILVLACAIIGTIVCLLSGGPGDENIPPVDSAQTKPLNLSVFVDLSDRISKQTDKMDQSEKDQIIINNLAESFIQKQSTEGFQKSGDSFQVVFYPAPTGSQTLAENLAINLKNIKGPKKKALLSFKNSYKDNLSALYKNALDEQDFFGSDIWGYFAKDKVSDLYRDDARNVIVILSDGYIYDEHNKLQEGKNYSYILARTLAEKDSGLIPCEISTPDVEIYFVECNANPQTDYPKMKNILEKWFKDMGVKSVDIQATDIPTNVSKHLNKSIFPQI